MDPITGAVTKAIFVDYKIHLYTSLRTAQGMVPPVVERNAEVLTVRGIDGRDIPEGHYELQAGDEHLRLKNLGGGVWTVLNPTRG